MLLFLLSLIVLTSCANPAPEDRDPIEIADSEIRYSIPLPTQIQVETVELNQTPFTVEVLDLNDPVGIHLPTEPLELKFNKPVDVSSGSVAINFIPEVEGVITWNESLDQLTFTPADEFTPGMKYSLSIAPTLRSIDGQALTTMRPISFRIESPPRISRRSPRESELSDRFPKINITFTKEMDKNSVESALSLQPEMDYELVWEYSHILSILFTDSLRSGDQYHFTLSRTAKDLYGISLRDDYQWSIELADLEVEIPSRDNPSNSDPITLLFNYPIVEESFERSFNISPHIEGKFEWDSGQRAVSFFPDPVFAPDTLYTISFTQPLLDSYQHDIGVASPITFRSLPPILAISPEHNQDYVQIDEIWINFDQAMDHERTENAIQIEPELPGSFTWEGNKLTFHLAGFLSARTRYSVTIGEGARDIDGRQVFNQPYTWSFTSDYYTRRSFFGESGSNIQIVDANGLRAVQFGLAEDEPTRVFFDLYKMDMRQFVDLAVQDPTFKSPSFVSVSGIQDPLRTWEITSGLDNEHWNIKQVFIPEDVPAGLYIMVMRINGRIHDQLVVILTKNTLMVKRAGRSLMIWATDIHGDVVSNVEIRLYTPDGSQIRETYTDERGVYRTTLHHEHEPFLILARDKNEDVSVAGVNSTWKQGTQYSHWWRRIRPITIQNFRAFVYTDRPIYKPGQSVWFKAILREEDDLRYTILPFGSPVDVVIRDARANMLQTFHLFTNRFGSIFGEFKLTEGAMLGDYKIDVLVGGERHAGEFKVEDYRKPDILIDVRTDADGYIQGEEISLDIDVEYLFGEPVVGAEVTVRQYQLGRYLGYWWEDPPEADEFESTWYMSSESSIHGVLDADGHFSVALQAKLGYEEYIWYSWKDSLQSSTWGIEVSVDDGSNQAVSAFAIIKVYNAAQKLRVKADHYYYTQGEEITIEAEVASFADEPVPNQQMWVELERWDRSSRSYVAIQDRVEMISDDFGVSRISFKMEQTGRLRLVLRSEDGMGNEVSSSDWIAVYEKKPVWATSNQTSDIAISVEKSEFSPFQTATLLIESSIDGPALITVERGSVLREKLIQLTPPITTVELSLHEVDVPNIFVTVSAWKAQLSAPGEYEYSNIPESELIRDSIELFVNSQVKELQVEIMPQEDSYLPGEEAEVKIIVRDNQGRPVSAEVSLAVVDEAIFSLSEELSESMVDVFYGRRLNAVQTFSSMAPYRWIWTPGRGGGGGWDGSPPNDLRSDFLDTAAWFPSLHTDASGEAIVRFRLPDNLTNWRVTARAITTDTKVGEATANLITHKELIVTPLIPRTLVSGDQVILSTVVHNYSPSGRWINVQLKASGLIQQSEAAQKIYLEPDETGVIGWNVKAGDFGEATVTVVATSGELQDAVNLTIPVQPLAEVDKFSEIGRVDGVFEMDFYLPEDALGASLLTVELSRSIDGSILSGLEYLTGYPYGCVEQIMSKALPNAVVGRALNIADQRYANLSYDLSERVNMGLQMLYAKQHQDGGWGWWYDDETHDYQTAWVIFGLAMTSEAGYQVDQEVIQRGVSWLSEHLAGMDPRTRAFALYGMTLAGEGDLAATLELANEEDGLDTFSLAALALTLDKLGERESAERLLGVLEETAQKHAARVYWELPYGDGYYRQKTMASSVRSTALVLSALIQIDPENELVPGIVRWLVEKRQPHGWGTTNETSFAILGLTDYVVLETRGDEQTEYVVEINGEQINQGTLSLDEPIERFNIGFDGMISGKNTVRILNSGDGPLYYSLHGNIYLEREVITADGEISIARKYYDAETNHMVESIEAGSLVKVEVVVDMPVLAITRV
jgi:uncharacterized protein YfaS (alpha-2-macroglobulin family)